MVLKLTKKAYTVSLVVAAACVLCSRVVVHMISICDAFEVHFVYTSVENLSLESYRLTRSLFFSFLFYRALFHTHIYREQLANQAGVGGKRGEGGESQKVGDRDKTLKRRVKKLKKKKKKKALVLKKKKKKTGS